MLAPVCGQKFVCKNVGAMHIVRLPAQTGAARTLCLHSIALVGGSFLSSDRVDSTLRPSINRWMFAIGLFAALPMLTFSLLAGRSLLNQQQTALHVELKQLADFGARALGNEVRVMFATLDSLATSDAALRGDYAALHAHASRIVALSPRIGGIAALDASGVARFSTLAPFATQLPPVTPAEIDKEVLATGLRDVSPLIVGPISGKKLVLFVVPVKYGGKTVMILRASMWTEAIAEVLYDQPEPASWIATVVDQNMIQIARSQDAARFVGQPATEATQAAIRAGKTTPYAAVSRDGVAMTANVAKVTGTQWNVVVAAPSTSLQTEVWQAFQSTLWIGLFCAVLSALGAWFLARALRKQLQLAAGTMSARAEASRKHPPTRGDDPL